MFLLGFLQTSLYRLPVIIRIYLFSEQSSLKYCHLNCLQNINFYGNAKPFKGQKTEEFTT